MLVLLTPLSKALCRQGRMIGALLNVASMKVILMRALWLCKSREETTCRRSIPLYRYELFEEVFFNGLILISVFTKSWFQLGNQGIFSDDFSSFKKKSSGIAMQLTVTYVCLYSNSKPSAEEIKFLPEGE